MSPPGIVGILAAFIGCSEPAAPDPDPMPPVRLDYEPPDESVRITQNQFQDFQIVDRGTLSIGAVIPETVQVGLYDTVHSAEDAEIVSLHELGHALGLCAHSLCSDVGYLMYTAPSMYEDDWPEHAIHNDELNAARMLRRLPQGLDMSVYPYR